jgi:hypothetical protein
MQVCASMRDIQVDAYFFRSFALFVMLFLINNPKSVFFHH